MIKFKEYLQEESNTYKEIIDTLTDMADEEICQFGDYLFDTFFDDSEEEAEEEEIFNLNDIKQMLKLLDSDTYTMILDDLMPSDIHTNSANVIYNMDESVSRRFMKSNSNHKKRKFMANSKSDLRKTKASRKRDNRANKAARKRYYRTNKSKIKQYQKSRNAAIKKGKHKVKIRRNT